MAMNRMSLFMMTLGLGQSFPTLEVDDLAPRAARAASYMLVMGLWRPQTAPGAPVPVSSCRLCMSCKYFFVCFTYNQSKKHIYNITVKTNTPIQYVKKRRGHSVILKCLS